MGGPIEGIIWVSEASENAVCDSPWWGCYVSVRDYNEDIMWVNQTMSVYYVTIREHIAPFFYVKIVYLERLTRKFKEYTQDFMDAQYTAVMPMRMRKMDVGKKRE